MRATCIQIEACKGKYTSTLYDFIEKIYVDRKSKMTVRGTNTNQFYIFHVNLMTHAMWPRKMFWKDPLVKGLPVI